MQTDARRVHLVLAATLAIVPAAAPAQSGPPRAATYMSDEEIKAVNATPGIDRTIRVVDIGTENLAVGIIHRGATAAAGGTGRGTDAAPAGRAAAMPGGIMHDSQSEGYVIVSGPRCDLTGSDLESGRFAQFGARVIRIGSGTRMWKNAHFQDLTPCARSRRFADFCSSSCSSA